MDEGGEGNCLIAQQEKKKVSNRIRTHLDPGLEGLAVLLLEGLLDVSQIDLRPADDDSDQGLVLGSHAGHRVVQTLSKVVNLRLAALDCKTKLAHWSL